MSLAQSIPWLILVLTSLIILLLRGRDHLESANRVVHECCLGNHLQLLDGTVVLCGLSFLLNPFRIERTYRFEYSCNGTDRHAGMITLVGSRAISLCIPPDHMVPGTVH